MTTSEGGGAQAPGVDPQIQAFLGQAWPLLMASGMRYWARAAESWAKLLQVGIQGMAAGSADPTRVAEDRAIQLDALRAGIREVVELPGEESRRLQAELDEIVARLWPGPERDKTGEHWRRWAVKP